MLTGKNSSCIQDLHSKTDAELAQNIRDGINDSESVEVLCQRHTGIYTQIVRGCVLSGSSINYDDLIADNKIKIYEWALKFDPERGNFCTYVGNMALFMCYDLIYGNKTKSVASTQCDPHVIDCTNEDSSYRSDQQASASDPNELTQMIFSFVEEIEDPRIRKVLNDRYCEDPKTYRQIASEMDCSYEWCRMLEGAGLEQLKKKCEKELNGESFSICYS